MRKLSTFLLSAALMSFSPVAGHANNTASSIASAISAPGRPANAVALDESRKPAAILSFLGLKPGMHAADLLSGTGYWAEIMARVVGPKGHVIAYQPDQFYNDSDGAAIWNGLLSREKNVTMTRYPFEHFVAPASSIDFAISNLNYHDQYWESVEYRISRSEPDEYVAALYTAMKPGGIVGIIDHVGSPGDTRDIVNKLHRIDPAVVKADFEKAGFVLEATSDLLRNPDDDHSKLVFDPAVRGKTDRFVFKFRKPK